MRSRLIEDWRLWWRYWSVRLNAIGLAILTGCQLISDAWSTMPPDLRAALPYARDVSILLFAAGIVARLVQQPNLTERKNGRG
ncbi:hypothetical protein ADT71_23940 [Novosphingobium sp. ST904]|nr:hypothetical protein ADT71_23940 [Novosphingobium sp. ST904]